MVGKPGECGEGGAQTGGQHDPPGRQPAPDQGGDSEPESGPRGHGTQKRYGNNLECHTKENLKTEGDILSKTRVKMRVMFDIQHSPPAHPHTWIRK